MLIEEALLGHLQGQTSLTDLVHKRIYYGYAPENVSIPYLVINKISGVREQTFNNVPGIVYSRFQFTAIDDDYPGAKNIISVLNTTSLLRDFCGIMGSSNTKVDFTSYENEVDISIDPSLKIYGVSADWFVYYHE